MVAFLWSIVDFGMRSSYVRMGLYGETYGGLWLKGLDGSGKGGVVVVVCVVVFCRKATLPILSLLEKVEAITR